MSIKIMSHVWERSQQKGSRLLLLLAIADHADENGFAWPGIATLAEKIRMSERHTKRLIGELEAESELYVDRRDYHNRYIVLCGVTDESLTAALVTRLGHTKAEAVAILEAQRSAGDKTDVEDGDNLSPSDKTGTQHGDTPAQHGDTPAQHGDTPAQHGDTHVPLTVKEPSLESSIEPLDDDDDARDPVLAEVARLYEQEIGGTMSPLLFDEILELTRTERNIDRWREVFKQSIGKYDRWAWIRKVIANPRGGARRGNGALRKKPSVLTVKTSNAPPTARQQRIREMMQARKSGGES